MLKWFDHAKRMGEERIVKNVYRTSVEGNMRKAVEKTERKRGMSERKGELLAGNNEACGRRYTGLNRR